MIFLAMPGENTSRDMRLGCRFSVQKNNNPTYAAKTTLDWIKNEKPNQWQNLKTAHHNPTDRQTDRATAILPRRMSKNFKTYICKADRYRSDAPDDLQL